MSFKSRRKQSLMKWTLLVFFLSPFTQAGPYIKKGGTISRSMGGAGRAGTEGTEAHLLNPATLTYAPIMGLSVFYGLISPPFRFSSDHEMGFSLVDNNPSNFFSGGVSIFRVRRHTSGNVKVRENYFHVSMAEFGFKKVAFGLSASYLTSKERKEEKGEFQHKQFNLSGGIHSFLSQNFSMALVYYNFLSPSSSIPLYLQQKREFSLGLQYKPLSSLKIRLDLSLPLTSDTKKLIYQWGVEAFSGKKVSVRIGNEWNSSQNKKSFTSGLSFNSQTFKVDYALEWSHFKSFSQDFQHNFGVRVPF